MRTQPTVRASARKAAAAKEGAGGKRPYSLSGIRLLIVEDEYLVAEEIAQDLARAGADVLAPVPDIGLALCSLAENEPGAAILDIDLRGRAVFPLADELMIRRLPFIFYTGYDDILIPARFKSVRCVRKPASGPELIRALMESRKTQRLAPAGGSTGTAGERIVAALPRLRSMALALTGERMSADRLVEAALRRAIAGVDQRPAVVPVEEWLATLVHSSAGGSSPYLH
jgi:DNA-binding LytR/AlgR family response regulator